MDSKKIMAIGAVIIIVAAAGGAIAWSNNKGDGDDGISIAYLNLNSYMPFIVGFSDGWFDDLGFDVKPVVVTGSGQAAVDALIGGSATIAATGDGPFAKAVGKYQDTDNKMVGLCQYTQASVAGHTWIVKESNTYGALGGNGVDAMHKTDGVVDNSLVVADQIKRISEAGEGRSESNHMFSVMVNKGSTTETVLMKWCISNNITYTTDETKEADMYIYGVPNATTDILVSGLDDFDAVACNDSYHAQIVSRISGIKDISDVSALNEASYSVLCTTTSNYEEHSEKIMKVLEVLKKINEWMEANETEAMKTVARIIDNDEGKYGTYVKTFDSTKHKVVWETDKLNSWVLTARIANYTVTEQTFVESCPVRDTINGWYASS